MRKATKAATSPIPIYVHKYDPDLTSGIHGHVGSPNSSLKVDVDTGEFYQRNTPTGQKLAANKLKLLRSALKKAGILGLGVTLFQAFTAENLKAAVETVGGALDPFGQIQGELSPDSYLPAGAIPAVIEQCP